MKKTFYLLLLFIFPQEYLDAQNKFSVDLNVGRYSKETGLFGPEYYSNKFSYINGFNACFNSSEKWQYYIGLRKLSSTIESGTDVTLESSEVKGIELKVGAKLSPRSHKKMFLSYGLEIFEEISNHKGTYWVDYPPTYEINHKKYYLGVAPSLTINVKIKNQIVVFADTRFRFGRVNLLQKESTQFDKELYPTKKYWLKVFEPLSSIGIKLKL